MLRTQSLALLFLPVVACAHAMKPPASIPAEPPARQATVEPPGCTPLPPLAALSAKKVIEEYGTGVDAYQLEGGVWLDEQALLINADFDFMIAMSMDGMGAGIAAAQRLADNGKKSKALEGFELSSGARARIDQWRSEGANAFFVLWGKDEGVLRLVVEEKVGCKERGGLVTKESASHPFEHGEGWFGTGLVQREADGLVQ